MRNLLFVAALFLAGCYGTEAPNTTMPLPSLPVLAVHAGDATIWQEYPASVEGSVNVEIRPQVSGYLEKIYVEEGAYVTKGQVLFKINDVEYNEQSNNAGASILAARAMVEKAEVEVDRLKPLVENKVISEVELKTAKANLNAARATFAQANSSKGSADITLGRTLIKSPVSGYISRIPYKTGSLVGKGELLPLTVVSEVNNVYAYFSMSETDFLHFTAGINGKSTEEKIHHVPPVSLQLPDNTIYGQKGKIELVEGQFDRASGTISFRAVFPNTDRLLRSGITGKIRIPSVQTGQIIVPQESTYELQDKVYVFALGDSNKVGGKQITISGKSNNYYLVSAGLKTGETIVYSGLQRLREGNMIAPQAISLDSMLQKSPLQ